MKLVLTQNEANINVDKNELKVSMLGWTTVQNMTVVRNEITQNQDWTKTFSDWENSVVISKVWQTWEYSDLKNIPNLAPFSHTHTKSQITDFAHTHAISDITWLDTRLSWIDSNIATKSNIWHTHTKADITDFWHNHTISEITGLQTNIDTINSNISNKSDTSYVDWIANSLNNSISNLESTKANITYVDQKVADLVSSSPQALDTLNELSKALWDDPNFATTISTQIWTKANSSDVYTKSEIDASLNTKVDKEAWKWLSTNDYTNTEKQQVADNKNNISTHISDKNNPHWVTKSQVWLWNVDNTSDANKPISTATQDALNLKADDSNTVHKTLNETLTGQKTFWAKILANGWINAWYTATSSTWAWANFENFWIARTADLDFFIDKDFQDEFAFFDKRLNSTTTFSTNPVNLSFLSNIYRDDATSIEWNQASWLTSLVITLDCSADQIWANWNWTYRIWITTRSTNVNNFGNVLIEAWDWSNYTQVFNWAWSWVWSSFASWISGRFLAPAWAWYNIQKLRITLTWISIWAWAMFRIQRLTLYHPTAQFNPWFLHRNGWNMFGWIVFKNVAWNVLEVRNGANTIIANIWPDWIVYTPNVVLTSPDSSKWKISVDNAWVLTTTKI